MVDVVQKVMYQYPYILNLENVNADGEGNVSFTFILDDDEIKQRQAEIKNESEKIISEIITDGMTDEEKDKAIFEYLENNTEYNYEAFEEAAAMNYSTDIIYKYPDTWNTYGILVNKLGVCQSYAMTYKLLSELSGLESRTVVGTLGGMGHAWNLVKINGVWTWIDTTNNAKVGGAPFWIFQTSGEFAKRNTFAATEEWELDNNLYIADTTDMSNDYYVENGIYADTPEEMIEQFKKYDGKDIYIKHGNFDVNNEAFLKEIVKVLYDKGVSLDEMKKGFGYLPGILFFKHN
jgi:hypothetical protein